MDHHWRSSDRPGVSARGTLYHHISFCFAAEGLSGLLKQSRQSPHLQGIKVAPIAPAMNHLLFADDSLLFVKANDEGAREVMELLDKYCNASGQRENLDKSSNF
jgi:hypothetical protein